MTDAAPSVQRLLRFTFYQNNSGSFVVDDNVCEVVCIQALCGADAVGKAAPVVTLYRVNAKGRPGIWACNEHRIEPDKELDAIVEGIAVATTGKEPGNV